MTRSCLAALLLLVPLAACGPSYSPNTYASNAAQQANKTDQGIIIGVRPVHISAAGTVAAWGRPLLGRLEEPQQVLPRDIVDEVEDRTLA